MYIHNSYSYEAAVMSLENLILPGVQPILVMCVAREIILIDLILHLKAPPQSQKSPRVNTILVNEMGPEQCLHGM